MHTITRRALWDEARPLFAITALLLIITAVVYPLAVLGIGQSLFHSEANGSIITVGGHAIGSSLIGQQFTQVQYFHPRPSAAGSGYDASSSGGSNLGPASKALIENVQQRVQAFIKENDLPPGTKVPVDAVTASASGLDPDISPATAALEVRRVAKARGVQPALVQSLVDEHTSQPALGFIGQPRVNVLELNIALDEQFPVQDR
ncbi:MAG TPA: K(+)-transporting ATPase subunit C [Tepidiformaceae bacterium]|nr:K(+)-transporting ATPase subunit C [Tepidiformaceae bacterium]